MYAILLNLFVGPSFINYTLSPRKVLQPGEKQYYKVIFKPTTCGTFSHTFNMELASWKSSYSISCVGNADIPKIDMTPAVLFKAKNIFDSRETAGSFKNCIYLKNNDIFDFGFILIRKYSSV